jgi:hypothetical protein
VVIVDKRFRLSKVKLLYTSLSRNIPLIIGTETIVALKNAFCMLLVGSLYAFCMLKKHTRSFRDALESDSRAVGCWGRFSLLSLARPAFAITGANRAHVRTR